MKQPLRLIIFDFDGTLGDPRRKIVPTMQDVMRELHLPVRDDAVCASTIGLPLKGCYAQMFPALSDSELDLCAETHHRLFAKNLKNIIPQTFPFVGETLKSLKKKGITLTIASSRSSQSLKELLGQLGLLELFSLIVGAQEVVEAKPHPEPVLKTLATLGFKAQETLVVGDMGVDILMGSRAGAKTCGVTWGNGSREELEQAGADLIINDMRELLSFFDE
ncbi:MAG: HAD-IA family hydrolase [Prevotella sp.]|nr:HAD-IA family hydrolase [Prevotella sp.]